MKVKILLITILMLSGVIAFSQNHDMADLTQKSNVFYFNDQPYTGGCYAKHPNGKIGLKGKFVEGKKEGKWSWWYDSGKLRRESEFINNKKEGMTTFWYENGVKAKEIIYRNDKNIDQKLWNEDGTRKPNPTFQESN